MDVSIIILLLAVFSPSLLKGQTTSSPTSSSLSGPCRSWLVPCGNEVWRCSTEENYGSSRYGPQLGCPSVYPLTTAPPPGDCQMVNGTCQFTNSTLECTTWLNTCQGYQCGTVSEYDAFLAEPGITCSYSSRHPQPNEICLPINGTCQWYNPCRAWRGFCSSGYNCGTEDQYYQFRFGPQPLCVLPPPGWVPPDQPGECAVMNGQCDWYNCTAWLNWCQTSWLCGTQYEEQIYRAGPIPPCPAPFPGYRPPAQPGTCQFDVLAGQCEFVRNSTNPCAVVDCIPGRVCRVNPVSGLAECLPSTCSQLNCHAGQVCEVNTSTGVASCVALCAVDNGGCADYQLCSVQQYNYSWCDPSPCRYTICYNAPYVSCSSTDVRAKCVANSRCVVQNKTQQVACVQSCFENNGGCDSDQVCINAVRDCDSSYGPYSCTSQVQCLNLNALSPTCPAGWEYSNCGSCDYTCEDLLAQDLVACPAVCKTGCFCPRGLITYRDRCVDPRECFVLLNNPPALNPLPVKPTTVLLIMTVPSMTSGGFKNRTRQFLTALQQLVQNSGYPQVDITIHAVYFDGELQVVVRLSGNQISAAKVPELVAVVSSNAGSLPVQVENVAAVPTQTAPTEGGLSVAVIIAIVMVAVLVLLVLTIVVLVVMLVHKHNASKRIRQQQLSNDMMYSKLTSAEYDEKCSSVTEDVPDNIQEEKKPL